jgi:hypothetical protein
MGKITDLVEKQGPVNGSLDKAGHGAGRPVKAPARCPKSVSANMASSRSAMFTATNSPSLPLALCIARATSSFRRPFPP